MNEFAERSRQYPEVRLTLGKGREAIVTLKIDRVEVGHLIVHHVDDDGAGIKQLLQGIQTIVQRTEGKVNSIMATQAEFQAKIDTINANTTASAAAAQSTAASLTDARAKLDTLLTNAGVPADKEAEILATLDDAIGTTGALKTFLEATAAGPVTAPEPEPVPVP